jgi:hypothetical protein
MWRLLVALSLLGGAPLLADGGCGGPLFVVERSTSSNRVVYEAHLRESGELDERRPITVYWRLSDGRQEKLNGLERSFVYGVDVSTEGGIVRFVVHALPGRPITLAAEGRCVRATTPIAGRRAVLLGVAVDAGPGLAVRSIELAGRDAVTGEELRERIDNASRDASR